MKADTTCIVCKKKGATKRRQNTAYVEDEKNWVVMCDSCFEENEAYWQERWEEYYTGCM